MSSNYSSEKRYKEKRMGRAEGTTTKAILLRTTSRDGAYIKVIVIRQTEYKDSAEKSLVIHVTDSQYYHTIILYWRTAIWILLSLRVVLMKKKYFTYTLKRNLRNIVLLRHCVSRENAFVKILSAKKYTIECNVTFLKPWQYLYIHIPYTE